MKNKLRIPRWYHKLFRIKPQRVLIIEMNGCQANVETLIFSGYLTGVSYHPVVGSDEDYLFAHIKSFDDVIRYYPFNQIFWDNDHRSFVYRC